jgi:hypothetical protein
MLKRFCLITLAIFSLLFTEASRPSAGAVSRGLNGWANKGQASADEKWGAWNRGTYLRGANVWLKRKGDKLYPTYTAQDLSDLATWGANYVNISYPGIYNEKPHRHSPKYGTEKKVLDGLHEIVTWASAKGLSVVIAFRTGPQNFEKRFDASNPPPEKLWSDPNASLSGPTCGARQPKSSGAKRLWSVTTSWLNPTPEGTELSGSIWRRRSSRLSGRSIP